MCKVALDAALGELPPLAHPPLPPELQAEGPAGVPSSSRSPDVVVVVGSAHLPGAGAQRGAPACVCVCVRIKICVCVHSTASAVMWWWWRAVAPARCGSACSPLMAQ